MRFSFLTAACRCCWVSVTARSARPKVLQRTRRHSPWWQPISTPTASSTWPRLTAAPTTFRSCSTPATPTRAAGRASRAAANFGAGDGPFSVTTGDFNADGKLDLATANRLRQRLDSARRRRGRLRGGSQLRRGRCSCLRHDGRLQRRWQARPRDGERSTPTTSRCCSATGRAASRRQPTSARATVLNP